MVFVAPLAAGRPSVTPDEEGYGANEGNRRSISKYTDIIFLNRLNANI